EVRNLRIAQRGQGCEPLTARASSPAWRSRRSDWGRAILVGTDIDAPRRGRRARAGSTGVCPRAGDAVAATHRLGGTHYGSPSPPAQRRPRESDPCQVDPPGGPSGSGPGRLPRGTAREAPQAQVRAWGSVELLQPRSP